MKNNKKEEAKKTQENISRPHFVDATFPANEPWKTNIYFGPRDGTGSHAHLVASGAAIFYLRDMEGTEIVKDGKKL